MDDYIAPHNREAETSVLGSIFIKPELMDECFLQADDFYDDRHQLIMQFMRFLEEIDKPVDILVIAEQAGKDISKLGGLTYFYELSQAVPSTANFEYYQNIVRKTSVKRKTMQILQNKISKLKIEDDPGYIDDIVAELEELSGGTTKQQQITKLSNTLFEYENVLSERKRKKGMSGISTVSKDLNRMSGGHQDEDLIIIAARPSIGKTAMLINDAIQATKHDKKSMLENETAAIVFSLEMPGDKMAERAVCSMVMIDNEKMRSGRFTAEDWEKFFYARQELDRMNIFIDDTPGITLQEIGSKVKKMKKKYSKLIVYVDYLQLVNPGKKGLKGHEAVTFVSRGLKNIARKNKVPVVALSSVSRECEKRNDKRPMMSDLRESGDIEFSADVIMFLYRDDYYNFESQKKNIIEIIIAKGRNIGTGTIEMIYNRTFSRFFEIDRIQEE